MSNVGFNKIQVKQLKSLLKTNNPNLETSIIKQVSSHIADVVDALSQTISETETRITENFRHDTKHESNKLRGDIKNLSTTMATKYQVDNHENRIKVLETKAFTSG
ncbi:hypothetical protein A2379_05300 [Candidatus Amesbacteria bacterium RIFOXYB1_FULL_47_13]|nr:MAG: hypothetical protein A2379_05300 [Candidatus Amesbacteria bacterium RIFOXYB1_FULL_47_13]HBC72521.1 hypothetical protein [Candidatus Amesbacteria bacterium]